jgi:hypothetical protein
MIAGGPLIAGCRNKTKKERGQAEFGGRSAPPTSVNAVIND